MPVLDPIPTRRPVARAQRYTPDRPCPVCEGYESAPRQQGLRCHGYRSSNGRFAFCAREEPSGSLPCSKKTALYRHGLGGDCPCGETHAAPPTVPAAPRPALNVTATYDYRDEIGRLLYQVCRLTPKGFRQRRPNGRGGWIWNRDGVRPVLYGLPELRAADPGEVVLIPEGEKDVDRLRALGFVATTNPDGASGWQDTFAAALQGRRVTILADKDQAGLRHAARVARSLSGVAASVTWVRLPGLAPLGAEHGPDVSDWLAAGHTAGELRRLIRRTRPLVVRRTPAPLAVRPSGLISFQALLRRPRRQVRWVVKDVLPAGGLSALVGKPKIGKTTLACGLSVAVMHGAPFLGRATRQGPVIYAAGAEAKDLEIREALRLMGARWRDPLFLYFEYLDPTPAPGLLDRLRRWVEDVHPVLIILDPLFDFVQVRDANDYMAMTRALKPLMAFARETDTHILGLHHFSKAVRGGADQILGSTAIFGKVDTAMLLRSAPGPQARLFTTLQRYGRPLADTVLRFDLATRTYTLGEPKEAADLGRIGRAILTFLGRQEAPVTEAVITANVTGKTLLIRKALRQLLAAGAVAREGPAGKKAPLATRSFPVHDPQ